MLIIAGCGRCGTGRDSILDVSEREGSSSKKQEKVSVLRSKQTGHKIKFHRTTAESVSQVPSCPTEAASSQISIWDLAWLFFDIWWAAEPNREKWNLRLQLFGKVCFSLALWEASFPDKMTAWCSLSYNINFAVLTSWGTLLSAQAPFYPEEARKKGATVSQVCNLGMHLGYDDFLGDAQQSFLDNRVRQLSTGRPIRL